MHGNYGKIYENRSNYENLHQFRILYTHFSSILISKFLTLQSLRHGSLSILSMVWNEIKKKISRK